MTSRRRSISQGSTLALFTYNPFLPPLIEYHHSILRRFYDVFNVVEKGGPMEGECLNVEAFLVCAESRYARYLLLLETFVQTINLKGPDLITAFNDTMPLPPW